MHKTILFLALGLFLSASVTANACDKDKASSKMGKGHSCCTKGAKAAMKDGKECSKDPKCVKDMKASKSTKTTAKKVEEKS